MNEYYYSQRQMKKAIVLISLSGHISLDVQACQAPLSHVHGLPAAFDFCLRATFKAFGIMHLEIPYQAYPHRMKICMLVSFDHCLS